MYLSIFVSFAKMLSKDTYQIITAKIKLDEVAEVSFTYLIGLLSY